MSLEADYHLKDTATKDGIFIRGQLVPLPVKDNHRTNEKLGIVIDFSHLNSVRLAGLAAHAQCRDISSLFPGADQK